MIEQAVVVFGHQGVARDEVVRQIDRCLDLPTVLEFEHRRRLAGDADAQRVPTLDRPVVADRHGCVAIEHLQQFQVFVAVDLSARRVS
jgi:hypothetical protein